MIKNLKYEHTEKNKIKINILSPKEKLSAILYLVERVGKKWKI